MGEKTHKETRGSGLGFKAPEISGGEVHKGCIRRIWGGQWYIRAMLALHRGNHSSETIAGPT